MHYGLYLSLRDLPSWIGFDDDRRFRGSLIPHENALLGFRNMDPG